MDNFTPWSSLLGGGIIGLSATLLLIFNGRTAGVSGIFEGLLSPRSSEFAWRAAFVVGLALGGAAYGLVSPEAFVFGLDRSVLAMIASGVLVGFGTRLGSGCTSGHGVCGLSALRKRSLVSVVTFISTGALVVFLMGRVGGAL